MTDCAFVCLNGRTVRLMMDTTWRERETPWALINSPSKGTLRGGVCKVRETNNETQLPTGQRVQSVPWQRTVLMSKFAPLCSVPFLSGLPFARASPFCILPFSITRIDQKVRV